MAQPIHLSPIEPTERYQSLDLLRGIAVLGILIMNIQSFSMIEAAYMNPMAFGDLTGLNKWTWILCHIFGDQKFMTIFSILFGAGIVLISERAVNKEISAASIHYRRIFWLFIIGVIHAYLLWHGDILVVYSFCAVLAFLFRKLSATKLLVIGLIVLSVSSILYLLFGWSIQFWPQESIDNTMLTWKPGSEHITKEIEAFQGSWLAQMPYRVKASLTFQTMVFFIWAGWRAGGLMLIGMSLYKWGILTANRSNRFYIWMMVIGFFVGLPIVIYGVISNFNANFSLEYSMFFGSQYNYWASLFVSIAYINLIMFMIQKFKKSRLLNYLSNVGRTALSNYLLQTILCTLLFYGHGFGLFARVERKYQILIVILVWFVQIILTQIWIKYYKFGPAEWLWRSLTYFKRQSFKLST